MAQASFANFTYIRINEITKWTSFDFGEPGEQTGANVLLYQLPEKPNTEVPVLYQIQSLIKNIDIRA